MTLYQELKDQIHVIIEQVVPHKIKTTTQKLTNKKPSAGWHLRNACHKLNVLQKRHARPRRIKRAQNKVELLKQQFASRKPQVES